MSDFFSQKVIFLRKKAENLQKLGQNAKFAV